MAQNNTVETTEATANIDNLQGFPIFGQGSFSFLLCRKPPTGASGGLTSPRPRGIHSDTVTTDTSDWENQRAESSAFFAELPEAIRDELSRQLLEAPHWKELLPALVFGREDEKLTVLSPSAYLLVASGVRTPPLGRMVVDGDLVVQDNSNIRVLPEALVRGECDIGRLPNLKESRLSGLGAMMLNACPELETVRGDVYGSASFCGNGLLHLGADFRCAGTLSIVDCPRLEVLNCRVGRNLSAVRTGLIRTGPALDCGGDATFAECPRLTLLKGRVGGDVHVVGRTAGNRKSVYCSGLVAPKAPEADARWWNIQGFAKGGAGKHAPEEGATSGKGLKRGGKNPVAGKSGGCQGLRDAAANFEAA